MRYFDYETVAHEAKIPPEKMKRLVQLIREEFPKDPLMRELHILRACMAIRDGHITLEDALKPEPSQADATARSSEVVRLCGRRVDISEENLEQTIEAPAYRDCHRTRRYAAFHPRSGI